MWFSILLLLFDASCAQKSDCDRGFLCENDECIQLSEVCDGFVNCGDGSDEICKKEPDCIAGFLCGNGKCLSPELFCDRKDDCGDDSDEIRVHGNATLFNGTACRQHWSTCLLPENQVTKSQQFCKKDLSCDDGFLCRSGECIEPASFCDGNTQCRDGDDELKELSYGRNLFCLSSRGDVKCSLPEGHVCDQIKHCTEGEDECLCTYNGTQVFLDLKCFRCLSSHSNVIPLARLCDGVFDCPDLSDECLCDDNQKPEICNKIEWEQRGLSFSISCTLNDTVKMLEAAQVCDAQNDCDGIEDEKDCDRDSSLTNNKMENLTRTRTHSDHPLYYCKSLNRHVKACDGRIECRTKAYYEECDSCPDTKPHFCDMYRSNIIHSCSYPGKMNWNTMMREPCDGIARCPNKVDELGCTDWFYCKKGTDKVFHVKWDNVCDKVDDCEDGSDEGDYQNCSYFSCNDDGSLKYIDNFRVCDGTSDCAKGSDECQDKCIKSVFSDTKLMIKNQGVVGFAWAISITAVIGNICVILNTTYVLIKQRQDNFVGKSSNINEALILNLSVADLLVGIYTLAIVAQNSQRERYCLLDQDWRSSITCSAIGSLLVIGSQQSVFTLVIITVFRTLFITKLRFDPRYKIFGLVIIAAWMTSVSFAVIPLMPNLEDYFIDSVWYKDNKLFTTINKTRVANLTNWLTLLHETNDSAEFISNIGSWATLEMLITKLNPKLTVQRKFGFYSTHAVCLPTFFPNRKTYTAWGYSLLIIFINFVSFVAVFVGNVIIYRSVTAPSMALSEDMRQKRAAAMRSKLSRIVITDFCCWIPVCIMGFIQLSGLDIPTDAYIPIALIVIPINSSLNPLLYYNVPDTLWDKFKAFYSRKCGDANDPGARANRGNIQPGEVIEMRANKQTIPESIKREVVVA